jgi:isocitrate dehydrogenase
MAKVPVTVAMGDGIGPEIMDAVLYLLGEVGAELEPEFIDVGQKVFAKGIMNGIDPKAWESIRRTKLFLKAPITTPQGGGYKSVNVTMRKAFGQFANVRQTRTFDGFVPSKHTGVDLVIIRENEEDLYAGIEYRQTRDTCQSVKLLSRTGCELICRYAFEYARTNGRKKVTCLVKDNIMKITDGLFSQVFKLIGTEFPELEKEVMIVDIGMAKVADSPEKFDVIVTENLYGDIVSDIASQISGSVGLAGSMNIGHGCAMFEAVHGSAPDIAGQGKANPSGLLNAAILMLYHIGQSKQGERLGNAWLYTLEQGQHTIDIARDKSKALTTSQFAKAVAANLGKKPSTLQPFPEGDGKAIKLPEYQHTTQSVRTKRLVGVDIFFDADDADPQQLGQTLERCTSGALTFEQLASRGMKMYPGKPDMPPVTDLWTVRFMALNGTEPLAADIRGLLHKIEANNLDWVQVQNLYTYDHVSGYSARHGE